MKNTYIIMGVSKIKVLSVKKQKKGFTLIEIVVVIAILGILSSIAVPKLSGFSEKARIKADEASLSTLNKATSMYASLNNVSGEDIFSETSSDPERMEVLRGNGLLDKEIEPQQKDVIFKWDKDKYLWAMASSDGTIIPAPEPESPGKTDEEIAAEEQKEAEEAAKTAGFVSVKNSDGGYTITQYTGNPGSVTIPSKIGNLPVTAIAANAFEKKKLTSVIIPDTVTSIGQYAFKGNQLSEVKLPKTLTTIEEGVFSENKLTTLTIPDSVESIGAWAFNDSILSEVEIPAKVRSIGNGAFKSNRLTKVVILGSKIEISTDLDLGSGKLYPAFYQNGTMGLAGVGTQISGQGTWRIGLLGWTK